MGLTDIVRRLCFCQWMTEAKHLLKFTTHHDGTQTDGHSKVFYINERLLEMRPFTVAHVKIECLI